MIKFRELTGPSLENALPNDVYVGTRDNKLWRVKQVQAVVEVQLEEVEPAPGTTTLTCATSLIEGCVGSEMSENLKRIHRVKS